MQSGIAQTETHTRGHVPSRMRHGYARIPNAPGREHVDSQSPNSTTITNVAQLDS